MAIVIDVNAIKVWILHDTRIFLHAFNNIFYVIKLNFSIWFVFPLRLFYTFFLNSM